MIANIIPLLQYQNENWPSYTGKSFFHYTNIETLQAIVLSKEWHFFDVLMQNDHQEFLFGIRVLNQALHRNKTALHHNNEPLRKSFERHKTNADKHKESIFIASFAENGDQLSQWRGYTEKGQGVCIEIDVVELNNKINEALGHSIELRKVIYEHSDQLQILNSILNELAGIAEPLERRSQFDDYEIAETFVHKVYENLPFFKHCGFFEESEVRISLPYTLNPRLEKKFKTTKNGSLRAYLPIRLVNDISEFSRIIKSVRIGPTVPRSQIITIQDFFKSAGINGLKIRTSKIPYR